MQLPLSPYFSNLSLSLLLSSLSVCRSYLCFFWSGALLHPPHTLCEGSLTLHLLRVRYPTSLSLEFISRCSKDWLVSISQKNLPLYLSISLNRIDCSLPRRHQCRHFLTVCPLLCCLIKLSLNSSTTMCCYSSCRNPIQNNLPSLVSCVPSPWEFDSHRDLQFSTNRCHHRSQS